MEKPKSLSLMRSSTMIVKASLTIIDNNPSQDCDETKLLTVIPKFKQFTTQYSLED